MSVLIEKPVIAADFQKVRSQTEDLCSPLQIEDYQIQPMADASPPKWHLAHTTWLFEEIILTHHFDGYKKFDKYFPALFNSYYRSIGAPWKQEERGAVSRPTVQTVKNYREYVESMFMRHIFIFFRSSIPHDTRTS